jgi:hypothetical protein
MSAMIGQRIAGGENDADMNSKPEKASCETSGPEISGSVGHAVQFTRSAYRSRKRRNVFAADP